MKQKNEITTYAQIVEMEPEEFIDYIYQYVPRIKMNAETIESVRAGASQMSRISDVMVFFTQIQAKINVRKRNLKWEADEAKSKGQEAEKKRSYEMMVDKDKVMDGAIKALDIQYRSINRAITVWMEDEKMHR